VAVTAAALVAVPAALAASSAGPTTVTVRVEGQARTLLPATTVKTAAGSITRGGAPAGKCPATSAQGALQDATHGRWTGSWSKQYSEYYLTGILGQTESTAKYYWAIYINNAYAESGACEIPLKKGDTVLFAVVPGKGKTPEVLGVKVPATVKAGAKLAPVVVAYTAKGKAEPLSGACTAAPAARSPESC